jgi:hypothetical protein
VPSGFSLNSQAPLTTVAELVSRAKTRETIAHFVNFDKQKALSPFAAAARTQFTGPVKSVACFSPDADEPVSLDFKESGGIASFTVPSTRLYSMVVVAQ